MIKYHDYVIRPIKFMPTSYEVVFDGKGKVPNILQGAFTSIGIAKDAIDRYLRIGSHAKTIVESGT